MQLEISISQESIVGKTIILNCKVSICALTYIQNLTVSQSCFKSYVIIRNKTEEKMSERMNKQRRKGESRDFRDVCSHTKIK